MNKYAWQRCQPLSREFTTIFRSADRTNKMLFFSEPSPDYIQRLFDPLIVKRAEQYAYDKKKYPSFGKYVASMNRNVLAYRNSGSSRVSSIQIRNIIGNFNILKFV